MSGKIAYCFVLIQQITPIAWFWLGVFWMWLGMIIVGIEKDYGQRKAKEDKMVQ